MKFDVLIVEDNKMIREGIIKGIDWDSIIKITEEIA